MNSVLVLYIPVIHKGYINLLEKYNGKVKTLYLLGEDVLSSLKAPREIRAIDANKIKDLVTGLGFSFGVRVLDLPTLRRISLKTIVTTSDSVSKKLVKKYFPEARVTYEKIFLRWDEGNVRSPLPPNFDEETEGAFHVKMMQRARRISENSSDWWRQVGAVIVRDGRVLSQAHNQYLPSENTPYIEGNPRDFIKAGTLGFLTTSVHAEQAAISKAAHQGISLKGSDLYLNSYPCPTCAKLMGLAGIKRCFFSGGNAYLNVEEVFKRMGIKTIFVREK